MKFISPFAKRICSVGDCTQISLNKMKSPNNPHTYKKNPRFIIISETLFEYRQPFFCGCVVTPASLSSYTRRNLISERLYLKWKLAFSAGDPECRSVSCGRDEGGSVLGEEWGRTRQVLYDATRAVASYKLQGEFYTLATFLDLANFFQIFHVFSKRRKSILCI